ncbi:class I SAM-dependent methyltransferase [Chitinophaga japonensis]|uniref:Methyltransferase family protein n=1 Tax=Chitinophaga japonensis TaxID=104662 RepID=A0A562T7X5_CHIJA|nr:class I SAM-dependent methyltransferase [Chitinophaga japonensis]TWI88980.1 methyltransferase family protein [Chitinophaga japonensis]
MKNTERFSNRVENYIRYRPHYPHAIIPALEEQTGLTPNTVVADIGAGTGISSLPFLENGNQVLGVEPNKEMREAAEKALQRYANFTAVAGSAEHTMLPDACADLVVAGQAFHWFNQEAARTEFRRIARGHGWVALIWNERETGTGFEKDYEQLLERYAVDYKTTHHRNVSMKQIAAFFAPAPCREQSFPNAQLFDLHGLKGRLLSSSYAPDAAHPAYAAMMRELEEIFYRHQQQNMVKFHYTTKLYTGQLLP